LRIANTFVLEKRISLHTAYVISGNLVERTTRISYAKIRSVGQHIKRGVWKLSKCTEDQSWPISVRQYLVLSLMKVVFKDHCYTEVGCEHIAVSDSCFKSDISKFCWLKVKLYHL